MQGFQMGLSIICSIGSACGVIYAAYSLIQKENNWREEIKKLQEQQNAIHTKTQKELGYINRGIVACLKGLIEQGCDGPVKEALENLEKYNTKSQHEVSFF